MFYSWCFLFIVAVYFVQALQPNSWPDNVIDRRVKRRTNYIMRGQAADREDFPFMVLITKGNALCGGVLHSSRIIITAKHCTQWRAREMSVELDVYDRFDRNEGRMNVKVLTVVRHATANIALLILEKDVVPSSSVQFLENLATVTPATGTNATAAGWGWMALPDGRIGFSNILQKLTLLIQSPEDCNSTELTLTSDEICAGNVAPPYRNVCHGDSGGPLLIKDNNNQWQLLGIVTAGPEHAEGCPDNSTSSAFVSIPSTIDWLREQSRVQWPVLEYKGCFRDSYHNRDFTKFLYVENNSPVTCAKECMIRGTDTIGIQGSNCSCGHSFGKHGPSQACSNTSCPGDDVNTCGGPMANSVYTLTLRYNTSISLFDIPGDDVEELRRLLYLGADPNQRDWWEHTPLMWYTRHLDTTPRPHVITLLCDVTDVNAQDNGGFTVLHYIVWALANSQHYAPAEERLTHAMATALAAGADPTIERYDGRTARQYAAALRQQTRPPPWKAQLSSKLERILAQAEASL